MLLRGGVFRLGTDSSPWAQNDNSRGEKISLFCVWVIFCVLLDWGRLKDMPGAEDFGDGPGLGDATLRGKRWLSVKNFAEGSQAVIIEMMSHRRKIRQCSFGIVIDPKMCQHERTQ